MVTKQSAVKKKVRGRGKESGVRSPLSAAEILPSDQVWMERIKKVSTDLADFYNFKEIETSILESANTLSRLAGGLAGSDGLFLVKAKKLGLVALRSDVYVSVVRAYLEHGLGRVFQPQKFFYWGPAFLTDSNQGALREVHQVGFETIGGANDPIYDAQIILVLDRFIKGLKIKNLKLLVNSSGCKNCRPAYRKRLQVYYKPHLKDLCDDCSGNFERDIFALLACQKEGCLEIREKAPIFLDKLCNSCTRHFKVVLEYLDELEIVYDLDTKLVFSSDFNFQTTFKLFSEDSKKLLALGGRHDYLAEFMGAKVTSALGCWADVGALIGEMKSQDVKLPARLQRNVFMVHVGELAKKRSLKVVEELRQNGVAVTEALGRESVKSQLKMAQRAGAQLALIFGQKEVYEESIIVRDLRTGLQETVILSKIVSEIQRRLKEKPLIEEK